ncbi:MAG: hypothetical protein ACJAYU_000057 [Bradymonadia bacterium]
MSYGVLDVTATQDGEQFDIADGAEVEVSIPAPANPEPET